MKNYGLGRRPSVDARDQNHLMAAALGPAIVRPTKKSWALVWRGDQKQTSMCVGFGWHGLLRAKPHLQREPLPAVIYEQAQANDEFTDTPPAGGSSVRGGAKALKLDGKITAYAWAFEIETVLNWIGLHGPVVFGTTWYADMFEPGKNGIVNVSGAVAGGHCYVAIGYDDKKKLLTCQNSWGTSWGIKGRFYLRYEDADKLIKESGGEACTATE